MTELRSWFRFLAFNCPVQIQITERDEEFRASVENLEISVVDVSEDEALKRLAALIWYKAKCLISTPSGRLSADKVRQKGMLFGHVNVLLSGMTPPITTCHPSGDVRKIDGRWVFHPAKTDYGETDFPIPEAFIDGIRTQGWDETNPSDGIFSARFSSEETVWLELLELSWKPEPSSEDLMARFAEATERSEKRIAEADAQIAALEAQGWKKVGSWSPGSATLVMEGGETKITVSTR